MALNKRTLILSSIILATSILGLLAFKSASVNPTQQNLIKEERKASQESKDYWYDGTAEISSYQLTQARYGELHKGTAVLVYVTEQFSSQSNTKADRPNYDDIPVLKLNKTVKFNTGIYPYSMMNSTFFPFEDGDQSVKISTSIQEWCGMTYTEMTNRGSLKFSHNSYFEGASYADKTIANALLEDDLWSLLRLNPELVPIGKVSLIPSMLYLSLMHQENKPYEAAASLEKGSDGTSSYSLSYPSLNRTLSIKFNSAFPYEVLGWDETYQSGYGPAKKQLTTQALLKKTLKTDYWNKNSNADSELRSTLGLN